MDKIRFEFNIDKANAVVLYLANKYDGISKMRLLKYVFFADLYHLEHYGRPILGDRYVAMDNGPVLSKLYDLLKNPTDDFKIVKNLIVVPNAKPDLGYLSKSDIEALDYVLEQYSQFETLELSELTHEFYSWIDARNNHPKSKNPPMLWENIISNPDVLAYLRENSGAMVF